MNVTFFCRGDSSSSSSAAQKVSGRFSRLTSPNAKTPAGNKAGRPRQQSWEALPWAAAANRHRLPDSGGTDRQNSELHMCDPKFSEDWTRPWGFWLRKVDACPRWTIFFRHGRTCKSPVVLSLF